MSGNGFDRLMRQADMARKDARMDGMDWTGSDLLSAARRLLDYFDNPDSHPDYIKDDVLNHLRETVEAEDEGMGSYGKHALEGTPRCPQCADKDPIISGLKSVNMQLARELERMRGEIRKLRKELREARDVATKLGTSLIEWSPNDVTAQTQALLAEWGQP